jgi:NAD(P)-dependent dehydrogenase (short-subunit alcohol dehydrogenase family)
VGSFANQKVIVIGGSSGMGREAASDVVSGEGSAVIVGRHSGRVDETVKTLSAWASVGIWSTRLGTSARSQEV